MSFCRYSLLIILLLTFSNTAVCAADFEPNYDESKIPAFTLPDPLTALDGSRIKSSQDWLQKRRPEVLELFRQHVYGRSPGAPENIDFDIYEQGQTGSAVRKQITITVTAGKKSQRLDMVMFLPTEAKKPTPVFLLLNFKGNHAISPDSAIEQPKSEIPARYSPPEKFRGEAKDRFPIEAIVARGYGVATIYCGDIDPDYHDDFKNGVHALYDSKNRPDDAWGTIAAWAWGLSRAMDYFEDDDDVDHKHVAVLGHSRLGKTSLWAGAQDDRFAMVISNDSGCGGAALSRRQIGETVGRINDIFPHWFCENFKQYNNNENALPVDQHMLISLIAPRPVYVASASEDRWADPHGEFLSCVYAGPVYKLFDLQGVGKNKLPEPDKPILSGYIGHHIRTGKHQLTPYDWNAYMDFADKHWK